MGQTILLSSLPSPRGGRAVVGSVLSLDPACAASRDRLPLEQNSQENFAACLFWSLFTLSHTTALPVPVISDPQVHTNEERFLPLPLQ